MLYKKIIVASVVEVLKKDTSDFEYKCYILQLDQLSVRTMCGIQ